MLQTPYYLIDKTKLLENMKKIQRLTDLSGAKALLALKCFATWGVFDFMRPFMAGTTSSSLYELRLGYETFNKENHAYSVAWAPHEMEEVCRYADKVIFNSVQQFKSLHNTVANHPLGLRLNPQISSSSFSLADPARPYSRLGETELEKIEEILPSLTGFMIHNNCENADFTKFNDMLAIIEEKFGALFTSVQWISLGGGIHFTAPDYPLEKFAERLKTFSQKYKVQIYLEPGEAAITQSTSLEVTVLDTLYNGKHIAIVDSSIEAHMLDLLIYRESAKILPNKGDYEIMLCGKSCLAGDIFGTFHFEKPLKVGDRISIQDAAGYTMVKKNWFNGVAMPSIAVRELDGSFCLLRSFDYTDYKSNLS